MAAARSTLGTVNIDIIDPAPQIDLDLDDSAASGSDFATTWTQGGGAVLIADSDAFVSDADSAQIQTIQIEITNLQDVGYELLFADTSGTSIGLIWDPNNGILRLSGPDTVANFTQVLRTVRYNNSAATPTGAARTITFIADDGTNLGNTATTTVNYAASNQAPTISLPGGALNYTENQSAQQIDATTTISDAEGNWDGGTLAVQITGNWEATDRLSIIDGAAGITLSGNDLIYGGQTIGTANATSVTGNATLTVTFNNNATNAGVQAAARAIGFDSTSENPSDLARTVTFAVTDADAASNNDTQVVNVTAVNDAPVNMVSGPKTAVEETPTAISGLSISDIDAASNDVTTRLVVTSGLLDVTLAGGASVSAGANGSADLTIQGSVADINSTLTTLTYTGNTDVSGAAADTLSVVTNDLGNTGAGGSNTVVNFVQIDITPVNNAPVATADPGVYDATLLAQNPLSYWRLGETSGPAAVDDGTSANAGTYQGGTLGQAGAINGDGNTAVRFDGATDYVEIAHSDDYLLDNGTIQLWFKADDATGGDLQHLFSKDSSGNDTGGHLSMYLTTAGRLEVRLQSASGSFYVTSSSTVSSGDWHHAAVSFGANGLQLYLDGNLEDTDAYAGGLGTTSGGSGNFEPIAIGAGTQSSGDLTVSPLNQWFAGLIDEVAILDGQLAAETIQDLFAIGRQHYLVAESEMLTVTAAQGLLVNDTDVDGDSLTAVLASGPSNAASFTLNPDGSFDYTPVAGFTGTDTFSYMPNDGTVNGNTATVTITVVAKPVVTLSGAAISYVEDDPATRIDTTATVTDSDSADFHNGSLTVDFQGTGTANDRLAIENEGTGAGQIGVNGSDVTYEGATIGSFEGGANGTTPLVIRFNSNATSVAAQALIRSITYENVSQNPSELARTVRFVIDDGDGATSDAVTRIVHVTAENDAPMATADPGGYAAKLLAQNPLSYWRLGESTGPGAADDGTTGNAGTYQGGSLGQAGAINGDTNTAVQFDGANDYVEIAHSDDYLLDNGTVQLWFNADCTGRRGLAARVLERLERL